MNTLSKKQYLENPCRAASIPYWKTKATPIPGGVKILHHDDFGEEHQQYIDEPYFRLMHSLHDLSAPVMPRGFSLCNATLDDFAEHIHQCYEGIGISEAELQGYTARPMYNAALWLAVKDKQAGDIVATGIAELDCEIGEGVLEWIQVSKNYRRGGLGSYLVSELLWRMKGLAQFATVSGQCRSPANPEALYRKCGFTGDDIWHILREENT